MMEELSLKQNVPRFKLNMRIIADALERESRRILYYDVCDECRLEGARIFYPGIIMKKIMCIWYREVKWMCSSESTRETPFWW